MVTIYENCDCCDEGCRGCPGLDTLSVTFNTTNIATHYCGSECDNYNNNTYELNYTESFYIEGRGCVDYWEGPGETCGGYTHWLTLYIQFFDESTTSSISFSIKREETDISSLATWSYPTHWTAPTIWNCSDALSDLETTGIQVSQCTWYYTGSHPTITISGY